MSEEEPVAPIIVKKIIEEGHGHHGGAWKVAYADFVTAMMAFFLLLWLLSMTTPEQKEGLADYFTPTIGLKDGKGIGFEGGKVKSNTPGIANRDTAAPGLTVGTVAQGPVHAVPTPKVTPNPDSDATSEDVKPSDVNEGVSREGESADVEAFKETAEQVRQMIERDPEIREFQNDVIVESAPDGLKIDLINDRKRPMFKGNSPLLTAEGKKILDAMASVVSRTPNNVALYGHTSSASNNANPEYTNWELSADRANAARRFLVTTQLEQGRVQRVVGKADSNLLMSDEPDNQRNERVTIMLLRGSYYKDNMKKILPSQKSLLSVPTVTEKKKDQEPAPQISDPDKPSIFDLE